MSEIMSLAPLSRDEERILESFDHQAPTTEQVERILAVRAACKVAADTMLRLLQPCADRTAALRLLHEAMMTANKSIACEASRAR